MKRITDYVTRRRNRKIYKKRMQLRCRHCRTIVIEINPQNIIHGTLSRSDKDYEKCNTLFLDEETMQHNISAISAADSQQGKIPCPNGNCSAKLGQWTWQGVNCSCGEWISPAFAFTRSKVDAL